MSNPIVEHDPQLLSILIEIDEVYQVRSLTPDIDPVEWMQAQHLLYQNGLRYEWALDEALRLYPHISVPAMTAAVKYVNRIEYLTDLGVYSDDD